MSVDKMLIKSCTTLLVLLSSLASGIGQGRIEPRHITFDGPPTVAPGTAISFQQYSEAGMLFTPVDSNPGAAFTRHGGGNAASPENGTAYVRTALGQSLMFRFSDDSLFDLNSVDLAEYSTVFQSPITVQFVCYQQGGGILTKDFTTDGIIDGTRPLADFEKFTFGPEFSSLTRVEIPNYGWSLDNLMVSVHVPEPSSGALLFLASAGLYFSRRFHKG